MSDFLIDMKNGTHLAPDYLFATCFGITKGQNNHTKKRFLRKSIIIGKYFYVRINYKVPPMIGGPYCWYDAHREIKFDNETDADKYFKYISEKYEYYRNNQAPEEK